MEANILFIYKEHDPPMALRMESADERVMATAEFLPRYNKHVNV